MKLGFRKVGAVGEAMVEMAPAGNGLYRRGFAGDTFNTAWHMAQLLEGVIPVGYVTRVGTDGLSAQFVAELAASGLGTSGILTDPARTMGLYLVELDGVERRFLYWRGASAARGLADDPAALAKAIGDAGLIHVSGITFAILSPGGRATLLDALAVARRGGALVSFDPNVRPRLWSSAEEIRETMVQALAVTDIALPSFDDEAATWGDASPADTVARLRLAGVREIVVKDGAGDVIVYCDGTSLSCPTPPIDGIVDTTGAGDAFNAGYLSGRVLGRDALTSARAGQAMAAEVLRTPGARAPKERVRVMSEELGLSRAGGSPSLSG